jgi:hypothetical protein
LFDIWTVHPILSELYNKVKLHWFDFNLKNI